MTNEPFKRSDIVTLQDPANPSLRQYKREHVEAADAQVRPPQPVAVSAGADSILPAAANRHHHHRLPTPTRLPEHICDNECHISTSHEIGRLLSRYIAVPTWPALTAQEQLDSKAKADAKVKVAKAAKAKRKREEEAAADPEAASRKARREYLAQVSAHVCACRYRCVSEREVNLTAPPGITTDGARCEKSDCRAHVWQLYVVIDHTCRKRRSLQQPYPQFSTGVSNRTRTQSMTMRRQPRRVPPPCQRHRLMRCAMSA